MKSTMALLALMCVAMTTSSTVAEQTLSYPKCRTTGDASKCCTLSASTSMAHHGYFLAQIEGKETVVTCKAAALECHLGNPRLRATQETYSSVPCPGMCCPAIPLRYDLDRSLSLIDTLCF